jgi:hypothetical protein
MNVFFRKMQINESTGSAVLQCTSQPVTNTIKKIAGVEVSASSTQSIVWGSLSLKDPSTGKTMRANHPTIQSLMQKLEPGHELVGFRFSSNPQIDMKTGEETNMFWVEAYDVENP